MKQQIRLPTTILSVTRCVWVLGLIAAILISTRALAEPFAYVTDADLDTVTVIDTKTNAVSTITLPGPPMAVAITPAADYAYVTTSGAGSVSVIDTKTQTLDSTIAIPGDYTMIWGLVISPDGTRAYVARDKSVEVLDIVNRTIMATVPVPGTFSNRTLAITPDGAKVYVADNSGYGAISVIDMATNNVAVINLTESHPYILDITPDGRHVYVEWGFSIGVIDTTTNTMAVTDYPSTSGEGGAISPDGQRLYVGGQFPDNNGVIFGVVVINTADNTVIKEIRIPQEGSHVFDIAVTPDGSRIYVARYSDVTVIDTTNYQIVAQIPLSGSRRRIAIAACPYDQDCDGLKDDVDGSHYPRGVADPLDEFNPDQFITEAQVKSHDFSDRANGGRTSGIVFDGRDRQFLNLPATNFDNERTALIDSIVMHHCASPFANCIATFRSNLDKSTHYVISRNGRVANMVDNGDTAYHARYYNARSIGIEMEGCWWDGGVITACDFPYAQKAVAANLVAALLNTHSQIPFLFPDDTAEILLGVTDSPLGDCPVGSKKVAGINVSGILRHKQIQPYFGVYQYTQQNGQAGNPVCGDEAKPDPGERFEWDRFPIRIANRRSDSNSQRPLVSVKDSIQPAKGVLITAAGGTPGAPPAEVIPHCTPSVDDLSRKAFDLYNNVVVRLTDGARVVVTCGSLELEVEAGTVEVDVAEILSVSLPTGANVKLSQVDAALVGIENFSQETSLTVSYNGQATILGPSQSADFEVETGNQAPTANAGQDQTVTKGSLVTLNGSGSDPDNGPSPLTFSWTQSGGPEAVSLTGENSATPTFTPTAVGTYTFTFTVSDGLETALDSVSVIVVYNFTGFFPPVDNPPTWNGAKAGSAIPVKFSLKGDQGMAIFLANSPTLQPITCESSAPIDALEETSTASNSGLHYDPTTDMYSYIWKTDKTWAGTCHQLTVKFIDGTSRPALFKFTK